VGTEAIVCFKAKLMTSSSRIVVVEGKQAIIYRTFPFEHGKSIILVD